MHTSVCTPSEVDHLLPADGQPFAKYDAILLSKLDATPFQYGRTIVMPSFEPEYSISVYKRSSSCGRSACYVAYAEVERNVDQLTNTGRNSEPAAGVKVERIDVQIPNKSAELLGRVWRQMLTGPQRPRPTPVPERQVITVDGTLVKFSIPQSNGAPLSGVLEDTGSFPGVKTRGLMFLVKLLLQYCHAKAGEHQFIVHQIDEQAAELLRLTTHTSAPAARVN